MKIAFQYHPGSTTRMTKRWGSFTAQHLCRGVDNWSIPAAQSVMWPVSAGYERKSCHIPAPPKRHVDFFFQSTDFGVHLLNMAQHFRNMEIWEEEKARMILAPSIMYIQYYVYVKNIYLYMENTDATLCYQMHLLPNWKSWLKLPLCRKQIKTREWNISGQNMPGTGDITFKLTIYIYMDNMFIFSHWPQDVPFFYPFPPPKKNPSPFWVVCFLYRSKLCPKTKTATPNNGPRQGCNLWCYHEDLRPWLVATFLVVVTSATLPETNIFTPGNRPGPKRKGLYSNHPFSGAIC